MTTPSAKTPIRQVAAWNLRATSTNPATEKLVLQPAPNDTETEFPDDRRMLVQSTDIRPGGKYYAVVKIQMRYEGQEPSDQRWAQGSGWLIDNNLLVTAGHCAYDHTYGFGRAIEVKVYVGFNGKDSVNSPGVQFRSGTSILTPTEWVKSYANRCNDVAFIKVDKAFDNIVPFTFRPTPTSATLRIGVVGYPGDKTFNGEEAAQMYEQYCLTAFDLTATRLNMLEYRTSTSPGLSGSPVIIRGMNEVVGTHVYGFGTKSEASVICGQFGNPYHGYRALMQSPIPDPSNHEKFVTLNVPETEDNHTPPPEPTTESFWDTLKTVVKVGTKIEQGSLTVGSPFLGPVGSPVAALAGAALGYAGRLAASNMTEASMIADARSVFPHDFTGYACRAILGEAVLQAVQEMDSSFAQRFNILHKIQDDWDSKKTKAKDLATIVGPALMEPALRIALNSTRASERPAEDEQYPVIAMPLGANNAGDPSNNRFVNDILEFAKQEGETEAFRNFTSEVLEVGTMIPPPRADDFKGFNRTEQGTSALNGINAGLQPHFETICHRALMGDAALRAIRSIPVEQLNQEGFFSPMLKTIKNIGKSVLELAPGVIRGVEPIVHQAIQRNVNESDDRDTKTGPAKTYAETSHLPRRAGNRTIYNNFMDQPPIVTPDFP